MDVDENSDSDHGSDEAGATVADKRQRQTLCLKAMRLPQMQFGGPHRIRYGLRPLRIISFTFARITSISARDGGSLAKGVSSVLTALLLPLVPLMAVASCAPVTSPLVPLGPSAPHRMPKVKRTLEPSNITPAVAASPGFRVVAAHRARASRRHARALRRHSVVNPPAPGNGGKFHGIGPHSRVPASFAGARKIGEGNFLVAAGFSG